MSANFAYLNTRDFEFIAQEWLPTEIVFAYEDFADYYSKDDVKSILEPFRKMVKQIVEPSNEDGNSNPCSFANGKVTTPPTFGPLFHKLQEDGWGTANIGYGEGAMTIAQLSKGSAWYTELLAHVTAGLAAATARDQTYLVGAVTWTQGEADYLANTAAATYVTSLNTLVSDLNSDIKAITGQARDVHVITNQLASHKFYGKTDPLIAKALLTATANPLVHLAVPMYWLTHAADNIHLVARSSKVMGAYYGLVYKRVVVDGATWTPLQPVSAQRLGKVAVIKFNVPVAPLVLDTTLVTVNTNYGFELVDSGGSPLTISSVALTGDNRVKITAAATIPAGAKVRYAWTGAGAVGPVNGPRGNLRDSQGGVVVFSPTDLAVPLHNWCPIFEYAL